MKQPAADPDIELEQKIALTSKRLALTGSKADWALLITLIRQRSPEQVERMEKERGLR